MKLFTEPFHRVFLDVPSVKFSSASIVTLHLTRCRPNGT